MKNQPTRVPDYELFGKMAVFVGAGGIFMSLALQSFIPVAVAGVAIFCVLCFVNGLR